jgi:hypothetical protein
MQFIIVLSVLLSYIFQSFSKILPVINEEFEVCDQGATYMTKDAEFIAINDTLTIVNGTVKMLRGENFLGFHYLALFCH